jgi:DNA repair exonuclease SbcCD nuclease subunit
LSSIFVADTHLDVHAWSNRPRVRGDSMYAFDQIVNHACESETVTEIFAAGDLIDVKKPPPEVANHVREAMDNLRDCNVKFYFIQGQHELSAGIPWFNALHAWPEWLHDSRVATSDGHAVQGIDWTPADKVEEAFEGVDDRTYILLMHQVWEEFMGNIRGCEASFSQVPYADTLFTGDFHESKFLRGKFTGAQSQPLTVISSGSTNIRKIDEPPVKSFWELDVDEWTEIHLRCRKRIDVDVMTENALDNLLDTWDSTLDDARGDAAALPANLQRPLVWVKFREDVPDALERIKRLVGDDAELFTKVIPVETEEAYVEREQRQKVIDRGLSGCLELLVPKDSEHYAPVLRLLESDDAVVELQKMKEERGL